MLRLFLGVYVSAAVTTLSFAGSLIQRLPDDGAWVCFHATEVWDDGTNRTAAINFKSVGKKMVDDAPCRWIELEFVFDEDAKPRILVWKFLIPEKELSSKGDPLSQVKEAWKQSEGEKSEKLTLDYVRSVRPRLDIWLSPAIADLRMTDERRQVEWQQGRIDCEVHAGSQRLEYPHIAVDVQYRLSMNDKVPFGVAAAELNVVDNVTGAEQVKGTIRFWMTDMGKDAVSKVKHKP